MTTFANLNTTSANIVSSLQSAETNAASLKASLAASGGFSALSLTGLATQSTWRTGVGDLRTALDEAIVSLALATREFTNVADRVGAIAAQD